MNEFHLNLSERDFIQKLTQKLSFLEENAIEDSNAALFDDFFINCYLKHLY